MSKQPTRILIVEDSLARMERLNEWLPDGVRLINARSAGVAIGMLKRDPGKVYQGIMLDYDLQSRAVVQSDLGMSGNDVMKAIVQNVDRDVPILVHSMNKTEPGRVVSELEGEGFFVTRIPMSKLTRSSFNDWIEIVAER